VASSVAIRTFIKPLTRMISPSDSTIARRWPVTRDFSAPAALGIQPMPGSTPYFFNVAPMAEVHFSPTEAFTLGIGRDWICSLRLEPERRRQPRITRRRRCDAQLSAIYRFTPLSCRPTLRSTADSARRMASFQIQRWNRVASGQVNWFSRNGPAVTKRRLPFTTMDVRNDDIQPGHSFVERQRRQPAAGVEADARIGLTPIFAVFAHGTFNDANTFTD